jgi:lysophospholipase L1-like esterase
MGKTYHLWMLLGLGACGRSYNDNKALIDVSAQPAIYDGADTVIYGRALALDDGTKHLSWAGTTIETRFTGQSVTANMKLINGKSRNFYQVSIDGQITEVRAVDKDTTRQTFDVGGAGGDPNSLMLVAPADGSHTLSLTKMNEAMDGELIFGGFEPEAGQSLLPTQRPTGRRIEFIGDSITCGYGNMGTISTKMLTESTSSDANSLRSCKTFLGKDVYEVSNAYLSWAPEVARSFKADWRLICWSGKGVYRNADNTQEDIMPEVYPRAVATDGNTSYDLSSWVPQAVVINLGTNDFGSVAQADLGGPPDIKKFTDNYVGLVKKVRKAYPDAWIILAVGPMLSDYYPKTFKALSKMRETINDVIAKLSDDRVQFFEFPLNINSDSDATGCEWHPDVDQDKLMATKFEAALQKYLGWKQ